MILTPESNIILIGKKPIINYVSSVSYQFLEMNATEVIIKAAGKNMGKAIEVAEAVTKKFLKGLVEIINIKSNTVDDGDFKGTTFSNYLNICSSLSIRTT